MFNAAMQAMGTSAPAGGSIDANRLREMLKVAVEANRSDRLVVFDADQRSVIREALDEVQFDLAGHESDEELCDLILSTSPRDLFGEMAPDSELALLKAFATEGGVAAINAAVQRAPGGQEAPMLKSIHRRLERHGLESPFAHHFAEAESDTALAPRG